MLEFIRLPETGSFSVSEGKSKKKNYSYRNVVEGEPGYPYLDPVRFPEGVEEGADSYILDVSDGEFSLRTKCSEVRDVIIGPFRRREMSTRGRVGLGDDVYPFGMKVTESVQREESEDDSLKRSFEIITRVGKFRESVVGEEMMDPHGNISKCYVRVEGRRVDDDVRKLLNDHMFHTRRYFPDFYSTSYDIAFSVLKLEVPCNTTQISVKESFIYEVDDEGEKLRSLHVVSRAIKNLEEATSIYRSMKDVIASSLSSIV